MASNDLKELGPEWEFERWCYDRALSIVTRKLVAEFGKRGSERDRAILCIAETRTDLGVSGYGNGGERPRPKLR